MSSQKLVPDLTPEQLRNRVRDLSPQQRQQLAQQLTTAQPSQLVVPQLVAYVVPHQQDSIDRTALRSALQTQLPSHMLPARTVVLAEMPRTANGKVDVKALPAPATTASVAVQSPVTDTEEILVQIWADVLGLNAVGRHDNFFELGGDSILSIQIISRAREAGLRLAPNQLFEHPTVATLAAVMQPEADVHSQVEQGIITGAVPLTPIQQWFFEQQMVAPHHWHQARLVALPEGCAVEDVASAIATLWRHHDALRLTVQPSGLYQQDETHLPQLQHIDLSDLAPAEQQRAVTVHSHRLCAETQLETRLMDVIYFERGEQQPWLLITLHHLVVDAVSWQILLDDLSRLLVQSKPLPAKTTAFKAWAGLLPQHIPTDEVDFWLRQVEGETVTFPEESSSGEPTEATAATVRVTLSPTDTQALLQEVPATYNTQINDILLTALAQTLLAWVGLEVGTVQVEVETHGRDSVIPETDLSRTVGWFTTTYPIRLTVRDRDLGHTLKAIKEQLRQIPRKGISYGLLRHLGSDAIRDQLKRYSSSVLFNYLGQLDRAKNPLLPQQELDINALRDPNNTRAYAHEINAWVTDNSLQVHWTYNSNSHTSETMNRLAQQYIHHLKAIIQHCTASQGGFTPSDFPDAGLEQTELDDFIGQLTQGGL